jgi:hypothetical protein
MSLRLIIVNKYNNEKRTIPVFIRNSDFKYHQKSIECTFTITGQKGYPHNSFTYALNPQLTFLIRRMRSKCLFSQSIIIIQIIYRN